MIYLDNNATTRLSNGVKKCILDNLDLYYNPSSLYSEAQQVKRKIEEARRNVAKLIGASPDNIIFTGCATESNNTVIRTSIDCSSLETKHIVVSSIEHLAILEAVRHYEKLGCIELTILPVDGYGRIRKEDLLAAIKQNTILVSIMLVNNEIGNIYPIKDFVEAVHAINPNTKFHTDATQAIGKLKVDVGELGVDFLTLSGHKFHAPKGIGSLYVKSSVLLSPLVIGGHQENGKRAGTENVPYIIGLAKAAELAQDALPYEATKVKELRDKLEKGILSKIYNARLNSSAYNRVPNTTNIGFEYIEGELILLNLDDIGICASSGSACTSGSLDPSHVLKAMGVPFTALHGSIRFSLSRYTTEEEINYTIEKMPEVVNKLTALSPFQKELKELKERKGIV